MKKSIFTILMSLIAIVCAGQQWTPITSDTPETIRTTLVSSSEEKITIKVQVDGFYTIATNTPRGEAYHVGVPKTISTSKAGEPELPMMAIPAIVGDHQHYSIRVVAAQYSDFNLEVAPSKGDFTRDINPDDVPYTYGEVYSQDAFFPSTQVGLYEPYILRDLRGQNMVVYPFAYNPISKTLRVYHELTIEMFSDGGQGQNTIARKSSSIKLDPEMAAIYGNQFINFGENMSKYTPMEEAGELLIICHDAFIDAMTPFVNWKKQIGRPTTIVGTSTTGTSDTAIKNYITQQYGTNDNLMYVLLVGDVAQIPGHSYSSSSYSGKSDNWYGQVVGNDPYNDIFVGRFSAEDVAHVTTQVNKVINYERDLNATATWLTNGEGIAAYAGSGGHFGEDDWQHINNIRTDLLGYNYTTVYQDYQNVSGYQGSAALVSQHFNEGTSIANYCNHGSETSWGVFNYNNSHVNALTNVNKLPIIWSVACLNGKYDHSTPCFAETWLRANNNNNPEAPTGAIGGMFSYISQPWVPPMYGQDEMVDILVESYSNNIKRTLAGTSMNGNMKILDQYGTNPGQGHGTYMSWILYGDPTLTLRNAVPADMGITHASSFGSGSTGFVVNATNGNGALATLTRNNEIMGSATINNGTATINFAPTGQTGTAILTVFGYNKITYIATINITSGGSDPLSVSVTANPTVIAQGSSSTLNASATGGNGSYTYNWTPAASLNNAHIQSPTATPMQTTTYNCTVSSGSESANASVTVTVVCPPSGLTATVQNTNNVRLTWNAANPAQSYKIYRNNSLIAQNITATNYLDSNLNPGTYSYQVATMYNGIESPKSSTATATINATLSVTASASPAIIAEGESSTLTATATGGSGSYTYNWTPAASLNNAHIQSPTATPTQTTTYTVTVTCGSETATATTTVTVIHAPTDVTVVLGDHPVITWNTQQPYSSFKVYRGEQMIASNIITTSYTDSEVTPCPEETYCYSVVTCYNLAEASSGEACASMELELYPVENAEGTYVWEQAEQFGTLLTWDRPSQSIHCWDLTGFNIYREEGINKTFQRIGNVAADETQSHYEYFDAIHIGAMAYMVKAVYQRDEEVLESEGDIIEVMVTGLDENSNGLVAYPNPSRGIIRVEAEGMRDLMVTDLFGQVLYRAQTDSESQTIDLSHLAKGIYLLQVNTGSGIATKRIVVE